MGPFQGQQKHGTLVVKKELHKNKERQRKREKNKDNNYVTKRLKRF